MSNHDATYRLWRQCPINLMYKYKLAWRMRTDRAAVEHIAGRKGAYARRA